ncbi:MAG: SsrA-binding protein SmpB [Leptonema sp. (in: Bacteria)]|nr:SsrA-binding protein SmpB [Leptonema sp. (in: bacteria)]
MAETQKRNQPTALINKRARHDYEILETVEAGIVLFGTEVKSLREGKADLADSFAVPKDEELFLLNLRIQPYRNATHFNHEEARSRKLLLKKSEITKLRSKVNEKRLTLVPLKLYFNQRGKVKVEIALCRGKKNIDKRQDERKKQDQRDMDRALKFKDRK